MAEESTKIIRIIIDSSKAVDGGRAAQRALEQIEKQTGSMAAAMDKAQASVAHVGTLLKVQLALAAAEVAARLYEMARQAFEAASGMEEVAQQVGLAAREFQGLQFVAAQSGVKLDEVGGAVSKFSIKMGEAADGSKEVIESLKRLGVQNLDLTGKLRPTADLMAEVAQKITDIEDPARRSAAIVDFFGKTGTKFLPVLEEMAKGLGNASLQAEKFGAMISDSTIRRLDELDDRFQRSALQHRASLANQLADAVDYGDKINSYLAGLAQKTNQAIKPAAGSSDAWLDSLREGFDKAAVMIARFNAQVVAVFKELPDQLGKAIVDGLNAALRTIGSGLSVINDFIASKLSYVGINAKTGGVPIPQLPGGGASVTDFRTRVGAAGDAAAYQLREQQLAETERIEQARVEARRQAASGQYAGSSRRFREDALTTTRTTGGGTSAPKASGGGGGDTSEDKIEKLRITLTAAAVAQDAMTAAAMRGDVAFQAQQAHADALQKAIEVYGGKLDATNPKVVALAGELEKLILRTKEGAAAQAFVVATTELEKQNVLLEAQNKLMNEAPEIQAREIALIKAKQEAEKGGTAITAEQVNQRRAAIEQNETLKLQAEQMKAANELWTEPLKQGLRSIQTAGADAWETILETGNLSFQSLGEVFTKTLRRMAAEFLALATIRPILTMAVDVVGPSGLGILGGNSAAQLGGSVGGGSSGGGGFLGSLLGGGGGGSIVNSGGGSGGGWLGRQFSGLNSFMQQPIYGGMGSAGLTGSPFYGPPSPSAGMFSGAGPSIGQGLGAAASIGMGAYGLLKGGQDTAGTIGSIGQIAGGIITMLPIPGAQIVGPIVSLLSSVIPGLFGGGPKIPPQPALAYGMGNFYSDGGSSYQYGGGSLGAGSAMTAGARAIGTNLQKAFRAAGLSAVPGNLYGGELASGMDHTLNGQEWQDRAYTQTALTLPGGGTEQLTYNDSSRDAQAAGEYLLAQVFKANVLRGGVSGAGEGLKAGLEKINPITSEDLDRVVSLGVAYDKLGKAINPAKDALDQISASFDDLKNFAAEAGLSLDPINDALKKQSTRSAQDFIDSMLDPLAVQMRALADERESAMASAEYIRDNVKDVYVDMDRIATYYTNKEAALRDQFYQGSITNLQALIDRLTYGDLANASPTLQLSGTKAAYDAALAQARAGDANAITNLSGYAESYLGVARQSFASSPEYQALAEQIRSALQEMAITLTGGGAAPTGSTTPSQQTATGQQIAQLTAMVQDMAAGREEDRRENAQLRDLLQRYVTGRAA